MWYISFHGGSPGVNNIQVFQDDGSQNSQVNLLPTKKSDPKLKELRGFYFMNDLLYVVNGYKKYSQVLIYKNDTGDYKFDQVLASKKKHDGIFHPYDLAFDTDGKCYISSQDTNVVTRIKPSKKSKKIAPYLKENYKKHKDFYKGTWVASSIGKLPKTAKPYPPKVKLPIGLDVQYTDPSDDRIKHSVRGVLFYNDFLLVSDEPANSVKVYAIKTGDYITEIKGKCLSAPVQLLESNDILYIGSSGNNSVVMYNLKNGFPSKSLAPSYFIQNKIDHISGMAFGDDGCFYAAERTSKTILKFPADGTGEGIKFIENLPDNPEFIMHQS